MFIYIFPFLGVSIMALAVFFAVKNRHSTSRFTTCLTLGVFFSTIFMVLPTEWNKEVFTEPFYAFVSSVLYSLKTLGGRQDVAQIESLALPFVLKLIYIAINYVSFVLAPISASSLIVSFFGDTGERMQYWVRFSDNCHIFSELNGNSLALAKGIKSSQKSGTLIFCNTKNADEKLAEEAKKLGAVLLYRTCDAMKTDFKHKNYCFYLISDCEDKNINHSIAIINKHRENTTHQITVYAFAQNDTNIKVVESMKHGNIGVRFVDEIVLFCNHLVDQHPLYETARPIDKGRSLISLTLIGAGRTGTQMLKTAVWYGQMIDHDLKIRVYDNNADTIEREFFGSCPELKSKEYDIEFITADVNHTGFAESIAKHSADTTYAVIAMGDDELNIIAADKLQGILRNINDFQPTPPIFTRVRSALMSKNLLNTDYLTDRNIRLFGGIDSIYSEKTLLNTELEKLALAVHLCYYGVLQKNCTDEAYQKAVKKFVDSAYNRRSSMASALHINPKLYMAKKLREQGLTDDEILEKLSQCEHLRWMAYTRGIGFTAATTEQMEKYAPLTGRDRDDMSKLHICLHDWDELDGLSDDFNRIMKVENEEAKTDFKDIDRFIIKNIDLILEKAKTL